MVSAPGISASPSEDNMRYFNVMILGPTQSPYEGNQLNSMQFGLHSYLVLYLGWQRILEDVLVLEIKRWENLKEFNVFRLFWDVRYALWIKIFLEVYKRFIFGVIFLLLIWASGPVTFKKDNGVLICHLHLEILALSNNIYREIFAENLFYMLHS